MSRSTANVPSRRRRKRLLKNAKGFRGARSKLIRSAKPTLLRAGRFAFIHRRLKKRTYRELWILRISAAVRARGTTYAKFIHGLKKANITLDRKVLSALAIEEPEVFDGLVEKAKAAIA